MARFGLDLSRLWNIVFRQKWIVVFIFLAVFISTFFFTNRLSPVYSAKALVRIEEPKGMGEFILSGKSAWGVDVYKELRFINSPPVMEEVAKRMALVPEWETLAGFKNISQSLAGRLEIRQVEKSNVIEIIARGSTAKGTAELASTVAQVYVDESLKERIGRIRSFRQSIEEQLNTLKTGLDESEQALMGLKEREGDIVLKRKGVEGQLANLELKLSELMQSYSEESPAIKGYKDQIEAARKEFNTLLNKELELKRLSREVEYNRGKYEDWRKRLTEVQITERDKTPYVGIIDLASLPESPIWPNKLFNMIVGAAAGLIMAVSYIFFMENTRTSLGTIEEIEGFMKLPVLGVIPYLHSKDKKEKHPWQPLHKKGRGKLSSLKEQLIIHYSPQSPASESYRSLRTNIVSTALEKGAKALLVTSAGPSEGKSITAANLAITAAQAGLRVLLIDGDLRRPILHNLFGLKKEPGLADYLTGTARWEDTLCTIIDILVKTPEWEEILRMPGLDDLKIITCGRLPLNPAEVLDSEETKIFVKEVKEKFDIILFDSPPVLPIPDASILGPKLDGVILVYQTGMVAKEALRRAKEQLESAGTSVKGIVLNSTTREMEAYPSYGDYKYKYYEGKKE